MRRRKLSLSQAGGPVRPWGDPRLARTLAACLDADPRAELPFTHGFHAYPARMHPVTARRVLEAFPAESVLDPFVGSGTTALEAVRRGARFAGIDLSPVAIEIAWTRTRVLSPEACRRVEAEGLRLAGRGLASLDERSGLPEWAQAERPWYSPHTLREVCLLKALIEEEPDAALRRILHCVLSSIAVKLSCQSSDSVVQVDRAFRARPRGAAFRWFREKCGELSGMMFRLGSDLHRRGVRVQEPVLTVGDARDMAIPGGSVDLVLTSPPYAGTYDYAAHHARRYPLLGFEAGAVEEREIGARRRGGEGYRRDMEACLGRMLSALTPGGWIVLVVGDGVESGLPFRADAWLRDAAPRFGARLVAGASRRRREPLGGFARFEHLLLLRSSPGR